VSHGLSWHAVSSTARLQGAVDARLTPDHQRQQLAIRWRAIARLRRIQRACTSGGSPFIAAKVGLGSDDC
jgi:hypothetical protein